MVGRAHTNPRHIPHCIQPLFSVSASRYRRYMRDDDDIPTFRADDPVEIDPDNMGIPQVEARWKARWAAIYAAEEQVEEVDFTQEHDPWKSRRKR